jgi:hypothetical protein
MDILTKRLVKKGVILGALVSILDSLLSPIFYEIAEKARQILSRNGYLNIQLDLDTRIIISMGQIICFGASGILPSILMGAFLGRLLSNTYLYPYRYFISAGTGILAAFSAVGIAFIPALLFGSVGRFELADLIYPILHTFFFMIGFLIMGKILISKCTSPLQPAS